MTSHDINYINDYNINIAQSLLSPPDFGTLAPHGCLDQLVLVLKKVVVTALRVFHYLFSEKHIWYNNQTAVNIIETYNSQSHSNPILQNKITQLYTSLSYRANGDASYAASITLNLREESQDEAHTPDVSSNIPDHLISAEEEMQTPNGEIIEQENLIPAEEEPMLIPPGDNPLLDHTAQTTIPPRIDLRVPLITEEEMQGFPANQTTRIPQNRNQTIHLPLINHQAEPPIDIHTLPPLTLKQICNSLTEAYLNGHKESYELYIPAAKPTNEVALLLFPIRDASNSYEIEDIDLRCRLESMSSEYTIILKRVSNIFEAVEIAQELKNQNKHIAHLELAGHGNENSLTWSTYPYGQLKAKTTGEYKIVNTQLTNLLNMLEPGATILSLSCKNGQERPGGQDNMLQHIARLAQGRKAFGTRVNNGKRLELTLYNIKPFHVVYTLNNDDVTACYQYPPNEGL